MDIDLRKQETVSKKLTKRDSEKKINDLESQLETKLHISAIDMDLPSTKDFNFDEIEEFLSQKPNLLSGTDCDNMRDLLSFIERFNLPNVIEAARVIYLVRKHKCMMDRQTIQANVRNSQTILLQKTLSNQKSQIHIKKLKLDTHQDELNRKISEYNKGAQRLMKTDKLNTNKIKTWRSYRTKHETDFERSQQEYQVEMHKNS